MAKPNPNIPGSFVATTNVWDVSRLYEIDVTSPEFKELLVRLYQNVNNIAILLNLKDTGIYNLFQIYTGQTYFPNPALNSGTPGTATNRQVARITINFGPLPNNSAKSVPHTISITPKTTFTHIYATASNTTAKNYIPVPADWILVDATNVTIATTSDMTAYTVVYVVLEYLQS